MAIGITPVDVFPLNYPKGDTSLPPMGAKAVPVLLDWNGGNEYTVNLLQVREQKSFGSLRCLWIDASKCIQNFTVAVNGTEQIFTILAGTTNFYPIINLNVPVIDFAMNAKEATIARIICLNFVPELSLQNPVTFPGSIVVSGNVAVTNFPATQPVSGTVAVSNFPATQPISGSVSVSNFPASQPVTGTFWQSTQPVSGTFWQATQPVSIAATINTAVTNFPAIQPVSGSISVSNFPSSQAVTGTFWQATQPVSGTFWQATQPVSIAGTVSDNIAQYGGTATSLGSKVSASSIPVVVASDQAGITTNIKSGIGIRTDLVSSSTPINVMNSTRANVYGIAIYSNAALLAAGSVVLTLKDGSGNAIFGLTLPTGVSTGLTGPILEAINSVNLPLVNGGNSPTMVLSSSLTSGNFIVVTQFM